MSKARGWVLIVCAIGFLACGTGRAEQDYEYVRGLVEKAGYEDLAIRMVGKLKASPIKETQLDGVVASAYLKRREALTAQQAADRPKLLEETKALFDVFLQDGAAKTHRLYATVQSDSATIDLDVANSLMKAGEDEKDAAKAQGLRQKASDMFSRVSSQLQAAVKAQEPALAALKKEIAEANKGNEDPLAPIPDKLVPKVDKIVGDFYRADAKYCQAVVAVIKALPEGNPARMEKAKAFHAYVDKRAEDFMDYPIVTQRYYFFLGQAYNEAGDYKKADEYFQGALDAVDPEGMAPGVKKMVTEVIRAVTIERVQMKQKQKDFRGVARDLRRFLYEDMPHLREQPVGKELQIEMVRAMIKTEDPDYAAACKEACVVVAGGGPYAVEARQILTEIIDACPPRDRRDLGISPDQWFEVAKGYYEKGSDLHLKGKAALDRDKEPAKAKELHAEAILYLERAIECCRRTIAVLRAKTTPLNVRLKLEPQCWSRMGLAFCKMERYHEAVIACEAGIVNFSDAAVLRMLKADPKAGKNIQTVTLAKEDDEEKLTPEVIKKLADNMPPAFSKQMFDEVISSISQCRNNCRFALSQNQRTSNTMYNQKLYVDGMKLLSGKEGVGSEAVYLMGEASRKLARAQDLARQTKMAEAEGEYQNVKLLCEKAIGLFAKVDQRSPDYENTVFQQGICAYLLFNLTLADRMGFKKDEKPKKLQEYALQCDGYFSKYEELIKRDRLDEAGIARRKQNMAKLKGFRVLLYYGKGDLEKALALTEEYLAFEKTSPDPDLKPRILFERFRSLLDVADKKPPVDSFKPMSQAEAMAEAQSQAVAEALAKAEAKAKAEGQAKADPPKEDLAREMVMIQMLAYRWNLLAKKVEKDESLYPQMDLRATQWQERLLTNRERSGEILTLDELIALANRHRRGGDYEKAFLTTKKAIEQNDPKGTNRKLPDATLIQYAAKMKGMLRLDDYDRTQQCKRDHEVLVDLLSHQPTNRNQPREKRPADDQFDRDYSKAARKIEEIRAAYKGLQTDRPELGPEPGKSYLQAIADEVDFRMKILRARDACCDVALQLADVAKKANNEAKRKEYLDVVTLQMELLLNEFENAPEMELKRAEILMQSGKYQEAMNTFMAIRGDAPPDSDLYAIASIDMSRCSLEMGALEDSVRFPHFLLVTAGENSSYVRKYWPDIRLFLDKCYAAGAPKLDESKMKRPPRMKTAEEIKLDEMDKKFVACKNNPQDYAKLSPNWWMDYAEVTWNVSEEYKGLAEKDKFLTKDFLKRLRTATEMSLECQKKETRDVKTKEALIAEYNRRLGEIKKIEEYVEGRAKETKPDATPAPDATPKPDAAPKPPDEKTGDKKAEPQDPKKEEPKKEDAKKEEAKKE